MGATHDFDDPGLVGALRAALLTAAPAIAPLRLFEVGQERGAADEARVGPTRPVDLGDPIAALQEAARALRREGWSSDLSRVRSDELTPGAWALEFAGCKEADSQLARLGSSSAPSCWLTAGWLCGWLGRALGVPIDVRESSCRAAGTDPVCRFEVRLGVSSTAPFERREGDQDLVARSAAMRAVLAQVESAARSEVPVLVEGPSGAGKSTVARAIHRRSARRRGPLLRIDLRTLGPGPILGEVLHADPSTRPAAHPSTRSAAHPSTRSAAHPSTRPATHPGRRPAAHPSTRPAAHPDARLSQVSESEGARSVTLLLTHVEALQPEQQAELRSELERHPARVLMTADLPASPDRRVDPLARALDALRIEVPPLRARREDILPLAQKLIAELSARHGTRAPRPSARARRALVQHDWPGQGRELERRLERALVLAEGPEIEPNDLDLSSGSPPPIHPTAPRTLEEVERAHVLEVLAEEKGHRRRAARLLGISEATLYRKLRAWQELA